MTNPPVLRCTFRVTGFPFKTGCQAQPECIRVGEPFTSRRKGDAGLVFPPVTVWANYICEACTVRSVLGRELGHPGDIRLLRLERMRTLDLAHNWSLATHQQYQTKLRFVQAFETKHAGLRVLRKTPLLAPPSGPEIALMWAEEEYSLRPSTGRGKPNRGQDPVSYATIRQLRSAVSQYAAWDLMVTHSGKFFVDQNRRILLQACRFTDDGGSTFFARGLSTRIGTETRPSVALLERHVRHLDSHLTAQYHSSTTITARLQWAKAGLANLCLWLGWLRSMETFDLRWCDFTVIEPRDGPLVDLPLGVGVVLLKLSEETKSLRTKKADVVIAYETLSGYQLGRWYHRVRTLSGVPLDPTTDLRPIFTTSGGTPWTSQFFRREYLYPSLELQRSQGDAFLTAFDGSMGNSIPDKFWSLHCYRRGARSHVSRGSRQGRFRKADGAQVYEHGRWRRKRSNEAIDVMYREWTIFDRIKLTLYSQ